MCVVSGRSLDDCKHSKNVAAEVTSCACLTSDLSLSGMSHGTTVCVCLSVCVFYQSGLCLSFFFFFMTFQNILLIPVVPQRFTTRPPHTHVYFYACEDLHRLDLSA